MAPATGVVHACKSKPEGDAGTLEVDTNGWLLTLRGGSQAVSTVPRFCPWCGLVLTPRRERG
jgi:hypothetical protein